MEKIFEQIDNLFVNGVINGIISIVIAGIVLIAINKLLNKFIKKKWPDNYVLQKRIKKIIPVSYTHLDVYKRQDIGAYVICIKR